MWEDRSLHTSSYLLPSAYYIFCKQLNIIFHGFKILTLSSKNHHINLEVVCGIN